MTAGIQAVQESSALLLEVADAGVVYAVALGLVIIFLVLAVRDLRLDGQRDLR